MAILTWEKEAEIEKKRQVGYLMRKVEYYTKVLNKYMETNPSEGEEYIQKLSDAEAEYNMATFNALVDKVMVMTGKTADEIVQFTPEEILNIYSNGRAEQAEYVDMAMFVSFLESVREYATTNDDEGLLKIIKDAEDTYLSNKKK